MATPGALAASSSSSAASANKKIIEVTSESVENGRMSYRARNISNMMGSRSNSSAASSKRNGEGLNEGSHSSLENTATSGRVVLNSRSNPMTVVSNPLPGADPNRGRGKFENVAARAASSSSSSSAAAAIPAAEAAEAAAASARPVTSARPSSYVNSAMARGHTPLLGRSATSFESNPSNTALFSSSAAPSASARGFAPSSASASSSSAQGTSPSAGLSGVPLGATPLGEGRSPRRGGRRKHRTHKQKHSKNRSHSCKHKHKQKHSKNRSHSCKHKHRQKHHKQKHSKQKRK